MSVRVGIDLASVQGVRESIETHGEHYLKRVYTDRELSDCSSSGKVDPERLAARFAAKEATLKTLRPDGDGVPLSSIEVRRSPAGWVDLALSGVAAELADAAGLVELTLSIAHEGGFACAVVVATQS